jgi:hypothetical protein
MIPLTFLLDKLNGKTKSRNLGPQGVLINEGDKTLVVWILGMQECVFSITLQYLKMKVAKLTQTIPNPFKDEIIGNSWWYYRSAHPKPRT